MTSRCDSRTLYELCTSTERAEVDQGFQRLGECLLPIARARLNAKYDGTIVEDCVQESLAAIWKNMAVGNGPRSADSFIAWAITITNRRCIDRARYEARRPITSTDDEMQDSDEVGLPEHSVDLDETTIELLLSISSHNRLSDRSKTILIEGFLFEKSDVELAQLLAATTGNIRLTRYRNLQSLRNDNEFLTALLHR